MYAGHPEELQERLDQLEDLCWGGAGDGAPTQVVGVDNPGRDAAWQALGG